MYIKFLDSKTPIECLVKQIAPNIVELRFADEIIENISGFRTYLDKKCEYDIGGNYYINYTTMYRNDETTAGNNGYQLSNDRSVYIPPEPAPEPEPYVPTLEEVKVVKKQEIMSAYKMVKAEGVDVEISTGKEHFPLTDEDVTFLMGKQFEIMSGNSDKISYQDSENHCKFYSRTDMQIIIQQALLFVNYQTTYRNNLCEWVEQCNTSEEVSAIYYGLEIPEEYQNEVYKSYLAQMAV